MRWYRFALLILAVTVVGSSALMDVVSLTEQHIRPQLLLIMLVYFAINAESYDAIICCFAVGLAADLTGTLMGPHFLSYGIIGTALSQIRKMVILKTTTQQAMAIFVTGLLVQLTAVMLMKFKAAGSANTGFSITLMTSMYSAILWFLIRIPVQAIGRWLGVGVYRFGGKTEDRI